MDPEETTTTEAQDKATEAASTEKKGDGGKPTIREHVASVRATTNSATSPAAKSDDEKEGEAEEKKEESTPETPKMYTAEEITEELKTKDLRELDPKRIPPELKTTLDKMQAAEGRKHKALNDKIAEMDLKLKQLDEMLDKAKSGKQETKPTEPEEDENLSYSKEEIREILKSNTGKAALAESLEELGYSRVDAKEAAESRLFREAIVAVKTDDERLQDETFFDETLEVIKEDERLSKLSKKENITGAEIRYVFLTAANKVAKARLEKSSADIEKDRTALAAEKERLKKLEKEERNRSTPASKAAGTRQPPGNSGERPTVREFVKMKRAGA